MTAVSQRIPNFLGGVSQQADEKMFPGQVKDALNCYPDTTQGMIKRPGGKFLGRLDGLSAGTANNNTWFSILRDTNEKYVATVSSAGVIKVWDLLTGLEKAVSYPTGKGPAIESYLTATDYRNIKTLTVNDFTYIVNSEKVVGTRSASSFNPKRRAVIVVTQVEYNTAYTIRINGTNYTYTTTSTASPPLKISDVTSGLQTALSGAGLSLIQVIDNTLYIEKTTDMDVSATAGLTGKDLRAFQFSVENLARLPEQSKHGMTVKINNTTSDKDDYYLQFVAEDGSSGKGYWEETVAPGIVPGLNPQTLPVALIRTGTNPASFTATFLDGTTTVNSLPLLWEDRLVGDDVSNSHPSFVGNTIEDIFLYNNRLGFLTDDSVAMSQAGDYYNFYNRSATTQTAADPIDLSVSSIKPAIVRSVVPIPQGLLLFSESQQFLMESTEGALTPASTSIRTLSSYECDRYIKPVDLGNTVMFVTRNQSWSRAYEIFSRGQRESPTVSEPGKVVPEWIPAGITRAVGSSQNGLWIASSKDQKYIYIYRYFDQGDERVMSCWVRWELPSNIIHTDIQNDILYVLTSGDEGYNINEFKLVLAPSTGGLINNQGRVVDPHLDTWCEVTDSTTMVSPVPPTAPAYSQSSDKTKVYLPTYFNSTYKIRYVVGLVKAGGNTYCGYTDVADILIDGGGKYFYIQGNVSANYIYVGYEYNMELTLPRYYFNLGEQGSDFAALTTISRMIYYVGLGGAVYFSISDNNRPTRVDVTGNSIAEVYTLDNSPFKDTFTYKIPIHQRSENYVMKVTSNTPFPVSLIAMMWEGQYYSGYYRRS